jgi:hypothetical protein
VHHEATPVEPLSENDILIAEFEYITGNAFQANEDRSKAASFFLVSVGSLVAAFLGAPTIPESAYSVIGILFIALTLFGLLTIAQLARLRLAWNDAAVAMNQIKKYYTARIPGLDNAFHWKSDTLPKKFKVASVSFYTVLEVTMLCGLTAAAGVYFLLAIGAPEKAVGQAQICGIITAVICPLLYIALLSVPVKKQ